MTTEGVTALNDGQQIDVALDGRPHRVRCGTTLATQLGHEPQQVTTAVNGTFVRREERGGCVLQAGDAVLLFQPIVGG
jgi:sulfur carrier protein